MSGGGSKKPEDGRRARPPGIIARWRALSRADRFLLVEAYATLAVASLAVAALPFRLIARSASGKADASAPAPEGNPVLDRRVHWAVLASARRSPWRAVCFQQGLAAHWMLQRRGIRSTLYYGAALKPGEGLSAHVWVRDGDVDVIGCEEASNFALLATFPPRNV